MRLREERGYGAAFSHLTYRIDAAAMRFYKVLHNRQAEAGSTCVTRAAGVNPVKPLEDPRKMIGWNSGPGIPHANPDTVHL